MPVSDAEYTKIIREMLNGGLKEHQSNKVLELSRRNNKKGAVAGFCSKDEMQQAKGRIYHSTEALLKDADSISHWTPNPYAWLGMSQKGTVYGHTENNLIQINCFVVDIDFKDGEEKPHEDDVLMNTLYEGLAPWLILDTPHGYQLIFAVRNYDENSGTYSKASYVSKANNYKSLRTAKKISENIRRAVKLSYDQVDIGCNHFGICRFPRKDNVVFHENKFTDTFENYLKWSYEFEKKHAPKKKKLKIVHKQQEKTAKFTEFRQSKTHWFDSVVHSDIREGDRNTVVYTLALACKQSKISADDCRNLIDQMHFEGGHFEQNEIEKSIASAYEGRFKKASWKYIERLTAAYGGKDQHSAENRQGQADRHHWYKYAKEREKRTRSHYSESMEDLTAYLETEQRRLENDETHIRTTLKKMAEETGIAVATLKVIIAQMKEDGVILCKTSRGRNGGLTIATRRFIETKVLMQVIAHRKDNVNYMKVLSAIYGEKTVQQLVLEIENRMKQADNASESPPEQYVQLRLETG